MTWLLAWNLLKRCWPVAVALLILGYHFWTLAEAAKGGRIKGAAEVQAKWDADKAARLIVLADAQRNLETETKRRQAAELAAEKAHEDADAHGKRLAADFDSRLRDVTAALRARALSAAVGDPAELAGGTGGAGGDSEIERLVGEVEDRARDAVQACTRDSARLEGVLVLAR